MIANLVPIFTGRFVPSLDGPAHLYNSQLIGSLITGGHNPIDACFMFNPRPVPNWTGHFLLTLFNSFLPAYIAEKIVLGFYLILLPLAFRAILRRQQQKNIAFSYLSLPFTYSLVFCLGFYNFSIAVALACVVFYLWINALRVHHGWKSTLLLTFLILICYFSHVFVFIILLIGLALLSSLHYLHVLLISQGERKIVLKGALRSVLLSMVIIAPALILLFAYGFWNPVKGNAPVYVAHEQLWEWLSCMVPLIGYHVGMDIVYTQKFLWLLLLILFVTIGVAITQAVKKNITIQGVMVKLFDTRNTWLLLALLLLVLYFRMPDIDAGAGYVSIRLLYLFYFFMVLWLCTIAKPRWLSVLAIMVVIHCCFNMAVNRINISRGMLNEANEYYDLSEMIKPNSIVLPVNAASNWDRGHFSGYLGADKPIAILDNYECEIDYFPVTWNMKQIPDFRFGNIEPLQQNSCLKWRTDTAHSEMKINYVFVNGSLKNLNDSCRIRLGAALEREFNVIYSSPNCRLYERK